MTSLPPSNEEWRALYLAAVDFNALQPWTWMEETDLFGVRNPSDGVVGYCCVIGKLGETLGLFVYPGAKGLESFHSLVDGNSDPQENEALYSLTCMTGFFEDRDDLDKADLQVIKALGLKFRGSRAWPLFRVHEPGYLPWYLERDHVLFLTLAFRQASNVCLRAKKNPELFSPPRPDLLLVRTAEGQAPAGAWLDTWLPPDQPLDEWTSPAVDEVKLRRLTKTITRRKGTWEVDFFYSPGAVTGEGRPYFPFVFLFVDHESGMVLNVQVVPLEGYGSEFQASFLAFIEKTTLLPERVLVRREEAQRLLQPLASRLEFRLDRVEGLPCLDEARQALTAYFGRPQP
jgi:hypothetical protein